MANYAVVLSLPPAVVWLTPMGELQLMARAKARQSGKPFRGALLPHEQEAKEQGQDLARRLEAARGMGAKRADD